MRPSVLPVLSQLKANFPPYDRLPDLCTFEQTKSFSIYFAQKRGGWNEPLKTRPSALPFCVEFRMWHQELCLHARQMCISRTFPASHFVWWGSCVVNGMLKSKNELTNCCCFGVWIFVLTWSVAQERTNIAVSSGSQNNWKPKRTCVALDRDNHVRPTSLKLKCLHTFYFFRPTRVIASRPL